MHSSPERTYGHQFLCPRLELVYTGLVSPAPVGNRVPTSTPSPVATPVPTPTITSTVTSVRDVPHFSWDISFGETLAVVIPLLVMVVAWCYRKWSARRAVAVEFARLPLDDVRVLPRVEHFARVMRFSIQRGQRKAVVLKVTPRFDIADEQITVRLVQGRGVNQAPPSTVTIENVEVVEGNTHFPFNTGAEPGVWRDTYFRPGYRDPVAPFFIAATISAKESWSGRLSFEVTVRGERQQVLLPFGVVLLDGESESNQHGP